MSLSDLLTYYDKAKYFPHSLSLEVENLFPTRLISNNVQQFLHLLFKGTESYYIHPELYGYCVSPLTAIPNVPLVDLPNVQKAYELLLDDEKREVLGYLTFPIHEQTHHIDHLITPFGVTFHLYCCAEYIAMQRFIPTLIKQRGRLSPKPLAYSDDLDFSDIRVSWDKIKYLLRFSNSYEGAPAYCIKDHDSGFIKLFGQKFRYCVVDSMLESVRISQGPKGYLRPKTILEARAITHSLLYILFLFDKKKEFALPAMRLYLSVYYPTILDSRTDNAIGNDLDYTFLFDLCASMYRDTFNFSDMLGKVSISSLEGWLRFIDGLTWYALQAPPRFENDKIPIVGPVERFILASNYFLKQARRNYNSAVELLIDMDSNEFLLRQGCLPIHECLSKSLAALENIRCYNTNVGNRNLRNHFRYIFKIQTHFLRERSKHGYNDLRGLPKNGNVMSGFRSEMDVDHLLLCHAKYGYKAKEDVTQWFVDRENLLFRYCLAPERKMLLERLQLRFPSLSPIKPATCSCGNQITDEIPINVRCYRGKCGQCGKLIKLKHK